MRPLTLAVALAAASIAATSASAVTIVQYRQTTAAPTVRLTNAAGGGYTLSSVANAAPVLVTLFDPSDSDNTLEVLARFTFSAVGDDAADVVGGFAFQNLDSGVFSLTALSSFSFLEGTGTNILSGSFTNGTLKGQLRGDAPTFSVTVPVSEIASTSDFYAPDRFTLSNFALGMSDASNPLRITAAGRMGNFSAASVGTFGAFDGGGSPAGVPEPSTWAMMILGFGAVGLSMRRRRTATRVSA